MQKLVIQGQINWFLIISHPLVLPLWVRACVCQVHQLATVPVAEEFYNKIWETLGCKQLKS